MSTRESVITLLEITRDTVQEILKLKVAAHQEGFVASNAASIAQAHFVPEAWFRAIYADETPVGFVMLSDDPVKPEYVLWRFMIDAQYQHLGFGRRSLELIFDHVRTRPGATELVLSVVPGEGSAGPFYEKLGFRYTGEVYEEELVMSRPL